MCMLMPALAFVFALAGCSDDENSQNAVTSQGEPAKLSISIVGKTDGSGVETRANGNQGTDESKVNDGIIYIFDGGGNVIKKVFLSMADFSSNSATKAVATTTAAQSISVLLNAGITDSTSLAGSMYDVPTKNKLEALMTQLTDPITGVAKQMKNNLMMSGWAGPIAFTGTPKTGTVNVTVSRIVSRVKVMWTFAPNSTYVNKIRLKGAVLLNVASSSMLFGSSLVPSSGVKFIQGLPLATFQAFPATTFKPAEANAMFNEAEFAVSPFAEPQEAENHFYIFENSATFPTIVALVADYNENGIDDGPNMTKYYPVFINRATTGGQNGMMDITRNNQYMVNITVKGIGVDNPYEPVDPASLTAIITVAPWNLEINVNQTFE